MAQRRVEKLVLYYMENVKMYNFKAEIPQNKFGRNMSKYLRYFVM